jgi:hypothetical protein
MTKRSVVTLLSNSKARFRRGGAFLRISTLFLLLAPSVISLSCEGQKGTAPSQKKANSPPAITSVRILPERPNLENQLSLVIQSQDPDGDMVTYGYQWIRNDVEIAGENGSILKAGNFRKGDVLQVKVVPSDGKDDGKPFLSDLVKIQNAPPVVEEVWIEPRMPTAEQELKAHEKSRDADGDTIYFTYQWEKNGVALPDERGDILARGRFQKGDSISVTIIPDDQEIMGTPRKSEPVTISNSPPMISSSPPAAVDGTTYVYQVKANDPDKDPVTFTLKSGPKGMKIDQQTGLIQWEIKKEDQGTYSIEIEASDNEGGKGVQRYTLAIEVR